MATLAGRPTSSYRLRSTVAAGPPRWKRAEQWPDRPALAQFVYLSLLLHAIAILLFGAPAGGSREGRAMWGSLDVTLLGPPREAPTPPALEPARIAPPAPRLERWLAPPPAKKVAPRPPPAPARAVQSAPTPAPIEVPIVVPQAIERIDTPALKIDKALPTPRMEVIEAPPVPIPTPLQPLGADVPRVERTLAEPPKIAVPVVQPVPVPAPLQPIVPDLPRVERTLAEPPKITVPLVQPVAPPVRVAPKVEPQRIETPALPAVPPQVEKPAVEAPALPAIPPKVEKPVVEAPAIPSTPQPAAIERAPEVAPQVAPKPVPPPAPVQEMAPKPEAPRIERPALPREEPAPRFIPRPSVPAPAPVEKRSGDYDPTKPAVDLDAVRARAGQLAREGVGQRALLPFPMPAPPPRKSKTEEALEKARKPDCRTAYKDLGLLAVVPLVANEFGEGTCRW